MLGVPRSVYSVLWSVVFTVHHSLSTVQWVLDTGMSRTRLGIYSENHVPMQDPNFQVELDKILITLNSHSAALLPVTQQTLFTAVYYAQRPTPNVASRRCTSGMYHDNRLPTIRNSRCTECRVCSRSWSGLLRRTIAHNRLRNRYNERVNVSVQNSKTSRRTECSSTN